MGSPRYFEGSVTPYQKRLEMYPFSQKKALVRRERRLNAWRHSQAQRFDAEGVPGPYSFDSISANACSVKGAFSPYCCYCPWHSWVYPRRIGGSQTPR